MIKKSILIILVFLYTFSCANQIDDKIKKNKKNQKQESKHKQETSKIIKNLVKDIQKEELQNDDVEKKLSTISNAIFLNKIKLKKSKALIIKLDKKSISLKKNTKIIENKIVDSIIEKYSVSLSKNLINKESLEDIINKEKYELILDNAKEKILKSNLNYFKVENDKRKNNQKSKELETYILKQEKQKEQFTALLKEREDSISKLKDKHERYQNVLKLIITKQSKLNSLLGNLNILKNKKIKANKIQKIKDIFAKKQLDKAHEIAKKEEQQKKQKESQKQKSVKISKKKTKPMKSTSKNIKIIAKKNFTDKIDLKVRNIGSSTKGISVSNYRGRKTISPLKSYKVIKKFGKYFDPVYKIELFNESVSLKSKTKNAKVFSILKGKIIYAKTNQGTLGSVVIVKHNNKLHTVYSQLSNIPKSLKVGKWIPKGYVVGRVYDTLIFQATKNDSYINPTKLFK